MTGMVKFYYERVISGAKKWTDVPPLWNEKVQTALKENGYQLNDDGTVTKREENGSTL